jgi:hypothetical protein
MLAPLAGYKTYIAAVLAVAGALAGALDGDMTWQQASAIVVPAVIGAALRHGLSTTVAALLSGIVDALAKAADQASKKAPAILLALGVSALLGGCAGGSSAPAPVQVDQTKALYYLQSVGCPIDQILLALGTNPLTPLAVAATAGPSGTVGLTIADTLLTQEQAPLCNVAVPPTAVAAAMPVPAAATH